MRFEYNGEQFILEFERTHKDVRVGYDKEKDEDIIAKSKFPYTTVKLIRDDPKFLPPIVFRTYTVGAHFTEQFSAEEGRMNALRMLSKTNSLSKEFKRAMWAAYMNRPRPISTPKGTISTPKKKQA